MSQDIIKGISDVYSILVIFHAILFFIPISCFSSFSWLSRIGVWLLSSILFPLVWIGFAVYNKIVDIKIEKSEKRT